MENRPSWQKISSKLQTTYTDFVLLPKETALLIIDMQYQCAHPDYGSGHILVKERGFSQADMDYYFDRLAKVVVPNHVKLLDFFRKHRLRVIYVAIGSALPDKSDIAKRKNPKYMPHIVDFEHNILEEIKPRPDELIINKTSSSAFNSTTIDQILRNMGINHLVITGVGTNVCVETTARDAADRGYRCIMVEDACATYTQSLHEAALLTFAVWYGKVKSTDEVIEELEKQMVSR